MKKGYFSHGSFTPFKPAEPGLPTEPVSTPGFKGVLDLPVKKAAVKKAAPTPAAPVKKAAVKKAAPTPAAPVKKAAKKK